MQYSFQTMNDILEGLPWIVSGSNKLGCIQWPFLVLECVRLYIGVITCTFMVFFRKCQVVQCEDAIQYANAFWWMLGPDSPVWNCNRRELPGALTDGKLWRVPNLGMPGMQGMPMMNNGMNGMMQPMGQMQMPFQQMQPQMNPMQPQARPVLLKGGFWMILDARWCCDFAYANYSSNFPVLPHCQGMGMPGQPQSTASNMGMPGMPQLSTKCPQHPLKAACFQNWCKMLWHTQVWARR